MSNVHQFSRKSAASKLRVDAMARAHVIHMNREEREREQAAENARARQRILDQLEVSFRLAYAVLGEKDTERMVPLVQSLAKMGRSS